MPDKVKTIHLTAVCGTAMSALAAMLKDFGYKVTGSDINAYPPISDFLSSKKIEMKQGYKPENIFYKPDLVIIGNAISADNPEALQVKEANLNYCSMPQAVNRFACANKKIILITGAHGKTTISAILASILYSAGLDPSFIIGGILKEFDTGYKIGKGEYIILEGDEYDTAFFDKGAKFLHYKPHLTVLTSIEFDHADIYHNIEHVKKSFKALLANISENGILFAYDSDKQIDSVIKSQTKKYNIKRYGLNKNADIQIRNLKFTKNRSEFKLFIQNKEFYQFSSSLIGEHNIINAAAAIGAAAALKISPEKIALGISGFAGVKRRQEIIGTKNGITIIDDFAHHPTAVKKTIKAVIDFYAPKKLIAVFEPKTNSSIRNIFQKEYANSFDKADIICIKKPVSFKNLPKNKRLSPEKLIEDLKQKNKKAYLFSDTEQIIDFIVKTARQSSIVLIMSNGDFDNIHNRLIASL
ncbi:MAG: UDP-N-acetylmuramate:L-alanyl-gamma-D-glutamyl-meso-diaminopimelate ligase [Deltaproteobacteria bacterium]|nr:UDP-N-acetylmuramate:L-alanyl-gamma-D-glutamyl-meso-diaminopimelate ligase [Deltaproteobacteria bacterium]